MLLVFMNYFWFFWLTLSLYFSSYFSFFNEEVLIFFSFCVVFFSLYNIIKFFFNEYVIHINLYIYSKIQFLIELGIFLSYFTEDILTKLKFFYRYSILKFYVLNKLFVRRIINNRGKRNKVFKLLKIKLIKTKNYFFNKFLIFSYFLKFSSYKLIFKLINLNINNFFFINHRILKNYTLISNLF